MKVLLLTPRPKLLIPAIIKSGDEYEVSMATPDVWPEGVDFIVSFGYRHIIKEPYLSMYEGRIINIHQSILPWNRGADPNFWSWFDDTPKGISIHLVDGGLDTGDCIMQLVVSRWRGGETLKTSYEFLNTCASQVFALEWGRFRLGRWFIVPKEGEGSYHHSKDKDEFMSMLPMGWETPVEVVANFGASRRVKHN